MTARIIKEVITGQGRGAYSYEDALTKIQSVKYGNIRATKPDVWAGFKKTKVAFKCKRCKTSFVKTISSVERSDGCSVCKQTAQLHHNSYTSDSYNMQLHGKFPNLSLAKGAVYVGAKTLTRHYCSTHDIEFVRMPTSVLGKGGCPECLVARRARGNRLRWGPTLLSRRTAQLEQIESYGKFKVVDKKFFLANPGKTVRVKCLVHNHIWNPGVHNIIKGHGCEYCRLDAITSNRYQRKGHKGKILQGYEPAGLDYLLFAGLRLSQIKGGAGEKVPVIPYTINGVDRKYLPDFYIEILNLIVEVKSTQSAGKKSRAVWATVVAKAKATIAAGFKYELWVMVKDKPLTLPENWYNLQYEEFITYL